jgi:glycerol uptake facilitator-like aquaporin
MTEQRAPRVGELMIEAAASGVLATIILSSGLGSAVERRSVVAALLGSLFVGYGTSVLLLTCRSGGHLNPLVTLASVSRGSIRPMNGLLFCVAQLLGAGSAAAAARLAATSLPTLSPDLVAFPVRMLREFVAAFGLLLIVWGVSPRVRTTIAAAAIGSYLAVTFWMTGSALFANPLVVIALLITDPDKGAALTAGAAALTGQIIGAAGGTLLARGLFGPLRRAPAQGRM